MLLRLRPSTPLPNHSVERLCSSKSCTNRTDKDAAGNLPRLIFLFLSVCLSLLLDLTDASFVPIPSGRRPTIVDPERRSKFHRIGLGKSIPIAMKLLVPYTQVLSDVDDTLKSSGGVNVAGVALGGIDVQYDRGEYYPGVFQFMLELSLHRTSSSTNHVPSPPKVAILTARAEEFKAALELKPDSSLGRAFRDAGKSMGLGDEWGIGPVLYGSVAEWVAQDRKGLRKFNNFERLISQDPTGAIMQYILVGDTGELDGEAGVTMLREYPEAVKAVFLHLVSSNEDGPKEKPAAKLVNGRPLLFFRTYVGAAAMAMQLGLMGEKGLLRVIDEAEKALKDIPKTSSKWIDLEKDIEEAFRILNID